MISSRLAAKDYTYLYSRKSFKDGQGRKTGKEKRFTPSRQLCTLEAMRMGAKGNLELMFVIIHVTQCIVKVD